MSKRDILEFLFKWHRSILSMSLFSSLTVLVLVYLIPPSYKAEASILVEKNRSPTMRTVFMPGLDAIEVQNTEIGILLSRPVIEGVVNELKPHKWQQKPSKLGRISKSISSTLQSLGLSSHLSRKEKWIKRLTKKIKAKPVVQSSIIKISFYAEDPEWSAQLINNVVDMYIKYHLKLFSPTGSSLLYKEKMLDLDNRIKNQLEEVGLLRKNLNQPVVERAKIEYSKNIGYIREKIIEQKGLLMEMLVHFTSTHEDVLTLKRNISRLELQNKSFKRKLIEIESQATIINKVLANLQADQETYNNYKTRYEDAKFAELSNVDMLNVRVVQYSPVATKPDHSRLFYIIIGCFGSFFLALFIALIREYFDHRVSDPTAIEAILGIPSVGSIKKFD